MSLMVKVVGHTKGKKKEKKKSKIPHNVTLLHYAME